LESVKNIKLCVFFILYVTKVLKNCETSPLWQIFPFLDCFLQISK